MSIFTKPVQQSTNIPLPCTGSVDEQNLQATKSYLNSLFTATGLVIPTPPAQPPDYGDYLNQYKQGIKAYESTLASMIGIGNKTILAVCTALQQYKLASPAKMYAIQYQQGMSTMAVDQRLLYLNWDFIDANTIRDVIFALAHESGHIFLEHITIMYQVMYLLYEKYCTTTLYKNIGANRVNQLLSQPFNNVLDMYTNQAVDDLPASHSANETAQAHYVFSQESLRYINITYGLALSAHEMNTLANVSSTNDLTDSLTTVGELFIIPINRKLDQASDQASDDGSPSSPDTESSGQEQGPDKSGNDNDNDNECDSDSDGNESGSECDSDSASGDEPSTDGEAQTTDGSEQSTDDQAGEAGGNQDVADTTDSESTESGDTGEQQDYVDQLQAAIDNNGDNVHVLAPEGGIDDDGNPVSATILDNQYVDDTNNFYEAVMEITSQQVGAEAGVFSYYRRRPRREHKQDWRKLLKKRYQFKSSVKKFPNTNKSYLLRGIMVPAANMGKTNVLVICDVSGSMCNDLDWQKNLGTIQSLCVGKFIKDVHVLPVDDQVHADKIKIYTARAGFDQDFEMLGGFGTDFGVAFEWLHQTKYVEKNKISSVIYVSDLYGSCNTDPDPRWGVVWIATEDHDQHMKALLEQRGMPVIVSDISRS